MAVTLGEPTGIVADTRQSRKRHVLHGLHGRGHELVFEFHGLVECPQHPDGIEPADKKLGNLIIGVMSDEAVASYKRFPLLPYEERKTMFENITSVTKVVEQKTLSYKDVLEKYRPDIVVHGDDWKEGFQKPLRNEVCTILASYGGQLVVISLFQNEKYEEIERRARSELSLPDIRRSRLRKMLAAKGLIIAMEAHDGITGLICEKTVISDQGGAHQFDAMWSSSLCDSTAEGKPDIELVDMTSRFRHINEIMEVTTKPIIFDGDTGGLTEHFVYTIRTLERMGVSMIIIEDKTGLKKNSLFGTEVTQTQDFIENFCEKIAAGKKAQKTRDFMICARIESLILERGMEDVSARAFAFTRAGADAIMIHSRKKDPSEIFEFCRNVQKRGHAHSHCGGAYLFQHSDRRRIQRERGEYRNLRKSADQDRISGYAGGRQNDPGKPPGKRGG